MTTFAARLAATRRGEVAIRHGEVAWSWAQVEEVLDPASLRLAAAELGPCRRVAVFAENSEHTIVAHIAAALGGCSLVPVNYHLTPPEVAYILSDSGARLLLVGPETASRGVEAAALAGGLDVVGWRDVAHPGVTSYDDWLAGAPPGDLPVDVPYRPPLLYTSGTTGRPKGTERPARPAPPATVAEYLEHAGLSRFAPFGSHAVIGPMYHTGPMAGAGSLVTGVPLVILDRFRAEDVLAAIDQWQIEATVMVPTHFVRLLQLPSEVRSRYDVSSLRYVLHTGSSCPVPVKQAMIEWFGPVLYEVYGATEVGTVCAIDSHEWLEHRGSVGRAVAPFEVMAVDEVGGRLPPGAEGVLYVKDPSGRGVVYHNDPEKSAAAHMAPGVFTLGEIGYVDDDGFVFITDRASDMVISGGVNIYPAEAEQVLMQHVGVADVACIGVPHPEMGEELKALVVAVDPSSPPTDAIEFCRARLAHYKAPRSVEFIDSLGRSPMGKLDKRALRAAHHARHPA